MAWKSAKVANDYKLNLDCIRSGSAVKWAKRKAELVPSGRSASKS